jgi:hypothetical protein
LIHVATHANRLAAQSSTVGNLRAEARTATMASTAAQTIWGTRSSFNRSRTSPLDIPIKQPTKFELAVARPLRELLGPSNDHDRTNEVIE